MINERHEAIAPYVDDALRNIESFFPLKGSDDVKNLQKFVHRYAGKGKVKTYQNSFGELVICPVLPALSATKANEWKHPIQVPYEFKVGDSGITACGESYVILEEKKDGKLIVNVKSHGTWKIGLRHADGTCIYNYTNKQRFALIPPKQPKKQIRTVYLNVYEDNTDVFCHATEADAKLHANDNARAVAIPVTFEFTPLR